MFKINYFISLNILIAIVQARNLPVSVTSDFPLPITDINNVQLSIMTDEVAAKLETEYMSYFSTGIESSSFKYLIAKLTATRTIIKMRKRRKNLWPENFNRLSDFEEPFDDSNLTRNRNRYSNREFSVADEFFYCTTCKALVKIVVRSIRNDQKMHEINKNYAESLNKTKSIIFHKQFTGDLMTHKSVNKSVNKRAIIREIILDACYRLNIQTVEVCAGLFDSNWPLLEHIITNSDINHKAVCSLLLFEFNICQADGQPHHNWTLNISDTATNITPLEESKYEMPSKTDRDVHILHITDVHHDPLYLPGSLAECEEPLCCQRHKELVQNSSKAAGYWGDYRDCDLPWHTIDQSLRHIKQTHGSKIDFIFQTGDIIDHMIWDTSIEKNKQVYRRVTERIYELFPDTPVYPCIGNHEPHPLNVFSPEYAPDNLSTHWLYEFLYELWSKWLPIETRETILKGGYYTVLAKPGYRIISLNNNDCYTNNWWLFYNGTDMKGQLMWLQDTLLKAEQNREFVHILAHIPSGDSTCWNVWSREFNRIIERFYPIISGIFNGHSHADEMHVHYSGKGHPIAVSFNGGSLTPWIYKNPNYRIYRVEPQKMEVVDHETWIFNLTAANLAGESEEPHWWQEYVFSKEFTDNLSPDGINKLLHKMAENPNFLRKYWRYKVTLSDPELKNGCDQKCLMETICRLATTINDKLQQCDNLRKKLLKALTIEQKGKLEVSEPGNKLKYHQEM